VEAERVCVFGDQPTGEAERGPDVVDDRATGLGEDVVRAPARGAARVVGLVLEQLDAQRGRLSGQHPPHRARLVVLEAGEDRVGEARPRRVASRHRVAVAGVEGRVETLDQLLAHGAQHGTDRCRPA